MRLERVEIQNYRAVRRLVIDMDEVTTIIGEHDCGKSSLISALSKLLDPERAGPLPTFVESDFHAPDGADENRAADLSITIWVRRRGDSGVAGPSSVGAAAAWEPARERFAVRVHARRAEGEAPGARAAVLEADGAEIPGADAVAVLEGVRRRMPALLIRWRTAPTEVVDADAGGAAGESGHRVLSIFRELSRPEAVLRERWATVMREVREVAGAIAGSFAPVDEPARSAEDLADQPHAFVAKGDWAAEADADPHRQVALLLVVGALLEAVPPGGLAPGAEPILLFDGVEEGLHPTWLAAVSSLAAELRAQQVITTQSGEVLSWVPLRSLRRLVRNAEGVEARAVGERTLSARERRRTAYHLRLNRGSSLFARCWVLVEGETEAWLVPEFARLCGVEFPSNGIRCIEFAQCGVAPLVKIADALGITWVLLADGDAAGQSYARAARDAGRGRRNEGCVFQLEEPDIEHHFYRHGYDEVISRAAGRHRALPSGASRGEVRRLIQEATKSVSKPGLALAVLESANERGPAAAPPAMREIIGIARDLARHG